MTNREEHWDATYADGGEDRASWFEPDPETSLALLDDLGVSTSRSVLDVGGGAARLVDRLLARGHSDLSVLDVSTRALELAQRRMGLAAASVTWIRADLLAWEPRRLFDVWHDRAVFHFLTDPAQQERYRQLLRAAVAPGGYVVVATFAADGPDHCSGLPVAGYRPGHLIEALGSDGLSFAEARREVHETPAGVAQPFTWVGLRRR